MSNGSVEENLLTPEDVSEILKISRAMAYVLMKRGEFPVVKIGKMVRVRRVDMDRYIQEKAASNAGLQES